MDEWLKIKTEYITTDTSYRKLAEKYGVNYQTICARSKAEGWIKLREQHRNRTFTKTVNKISGQQAKQAAKINDLADKLLVKLEQAIEELDLQVTTNKIKTVTGDTEQTMEFKVASEGGTVDRAGLRQLTAALRELKDIKGELSDLDRQEQQARIANLQKQAAKNDDAKAGSVTIQLAGGLDKYAQ